MFPNSALKHRLKVQRRAARKRAQYFVMRNVVPLNRLEWQIGENSFRILANSIPKAGTNLLSRLLRLLPNTVGRWTYHVDESLPGVARQIESGRPGQVITAHLPWGQSLAGQLNSLNYKTFLMVRDPRDVILSGVHYVTYMDTSHPLHEYFKALPDDGARLLAMINPPTNELSIPDIWKNNSFRTFLPWLDECSCMLIRFEELVGERGGGSESLQHECIQRVARHLEVELGDSHIKRIGSDLFGDRSRTFRKGQIGDWNNHFNSVHKAVYKERAGDVLVRLGYESDLDW